MAQIRGDMKTTQRLFSNDTEISHMTRIASDGLPPTREPEEKPRSMRQRFPTTTSEEDPAHDVSNMSIEVWQPQVVTAPRPPPELAIIPATPTDTVTIRQPVQDQRSPLQYSGPSRPSSSIRSSANEDLDRFVSSSTVAGTTLTSGSAGSFVKHAGPKQMRRIGPEDVIGALSDKVGRMVLDRQRMKWVKDTALAALTAAREREEDEESEDPFRDIESLRDEDSTHPEEESESRIEEIVEDDDDPEEAVLNSFSFDDSSAAICPVMTGISRPDDGDSEDSGVVVDDPLTDSDESLEGEFAEYTGQQHEEITDDVSLREFPPPPPRSNAVFSTPLPLRPATIISAGATPFPSAGQSGSAKSNSVTPISALKDPNRSKAPANLKHRRSVSFSDGKRDGPIRGLNGKVGEASDSESGNEDLGKSVTGSLFEPSVRSKRIAGMLDDLQDGCGFGSLSVYPVVSPLFSR